MKCAGDGGESPVFSMESIGAARAEAGKTGRPVVEVLEAQSGLPPDAFTACLGRTFRYSVVSMQSMHRMTPAFDVVPYYEAVRRGCLVFADEGRALLLVIADPFNTPLLAWGAVFIDRPFRVCLAHRGDLAAFFVRHEESVHAMDDALPHEDHESLPGSRVEDLSLQRINEDSSPVVKLVHSTLYDALKIKASDIHLEIDGSGLVIKYRLDGVLNTVGSAPGMALAEQVISRIKVMSELDIAERRIPQDGRFKVAIKGREVDFRVSIMPSVFGEDAVLRLLDSRAISDQVKGLRLHHLGFDEASLVFLRRLVHEPYGMVLVTGPTGSGKTTTLYAAISEINHGQDKIVTIEDPVEYQLAGVLQIPVNEKKGLTFARGLRSILRHDPDKIMVGEIRDTETAQIAIQSALTGHLVLTTVHANNVFDVIGRFMHMGVDIYGFVSALNGILAQRLLRLVCSHCAVPYAPDAALLADSGISPEAAKTFNFRIGKGCGQCRGTGYKGRKAIGERLHLTDEIRELIISRAPIRAIKEAARRGGTRYLRESALDLVRLGETSLQEVNRVTFVA